MLLIQVSSLLLLSSTVFAADFTAKRGIIDEALPDFGLFNGYGPNSLDIFHSGPLAFNQPAAPQKHYVPSPGEIAAAIQAAKEASASVTAAQHRVQDAKDEVLNQQHIADHKQAQAALALQKTEAAAAVQQQEAKSAATALVQAQQRLGQAKSEVAQLQRVASAKEAHAAAVIQKSAAAAAAQIQRNDAAARKISALQQSSSDSIRQAAAAKEGTLSATSAALAASSGHDGGPHAASWVSAHNFVRVHPWG